MIWPLQWMNLTQKIPGWCNNFPIVVMTKIIVWYKNSFKNFGGNRGDIANLKIKTVYFNSMGHSKITGTVFHCLGHMLAHCTVWALESRFVRVPCWEPWLGWQVVSLSKTALSTLLISAVSLKEHNSCQCGPLRNLKAGVSRIYKIKMYAPERVSLIR